MAFSNNPQPTSGNGLFSYIHKQKEGKDIYFLANSSADEVNTRAELRGKLKLQWWDPHTGDISEIRDVRYIEKAGKPYTTFPLKLNPVASVFAVGISVP